MPPSRQSRARIPRPGRPPPGAHAPPSRQRQPGLDQPGQRLKPRQARRRLVPAPRQKHRLRRQGPVIGVRLRLVARPHATTTSAWLIQRISRRPVRSGVQPGPCPLPNRAIQSHVQSCARLRAALSPTAARSSSQANPCASTASPGRRSAHPKSPHRGASTTCPRDTEIARHQLLAAGIQPDGARLGLDDKPVAGRRPQRTPHRIADSLSLPPPLLLPARHARPPAAPPGSGSFRCHHSPLP